MREDVISLIDFTDAVGVITRVAAASRPAVDAALVELASSTAAAPSGVQFKLAGKPVSVPAGRNVKVIVTPAKTTRVTG